jgi:hypothetical protein
LLNEKDLGGAWLEKLSFLLDPCFSEQFNGLIFLGTNECLGSILFLIKVIHFFS